jgi:hypothetical protein
MTPPVPRHVGVEATIPVRCEPSPKNADAVTEDVATIEFCTVTLDSTVACPSMVKDSVATNTSNVLTVLEWQITGHPTRIPRTNLHVFKIEIVFFAWDAIFIGAILH